MHKEVVWQEVSASHDGMKTGWGGGGREGGSRVSAGPTRRIQRAGREPLTPLTIVSMSSSPIRSPSIELAASTNFRRSSGSGAALMPPGAHTSPTRPSSLPRADATAADVGSADRDDDL